MKIFKDRQHAGLELANLLQQYHLSPNVLVMALPRGGVPIGYEIAKALHVPFDIFLVRKISLPKQKELAIGAIADGNVCVFNDKIKDMLDVVEQEEVDKIIESEKEELKRRNQMYRQGKTFPEIKDHHIILVDDGIATGASIKAAILALQQHQPSAISIAVPVAPNTTLEVLKPLVKEIICLDPVESFSCVAESYVYFPQVTDEEVINTLKESGFDI